MENFSPVALGFLGSLAAGSLTAIGAIPVLFGTVPKRSTRDMLLGFAAGVMLAASFFSLIIPALEAAEHQFTYSAAPAAIVCLAILLGMGAVAFMNEKLPHEHFETGREGPDAASLRRVWLFIIAITIHNFPEGLAVGVGFGSNGLSGGMALAIGIGLQNAPEGLAVAVWNCSINGACRTCRGSYWRWNYHAVTTITTLGVSFCRWCNVVCDKP